MFKNLSSLMLLLLAADASINSSMAKESEAVARVRVFNQPGDKLRFHSKKTCYDKASMFGLVSNGLSVSNGSSYLHDNKVVGMPMAADTPKKFHEYVVQVGGPITIEGAHVVSGYAGQSYYTRTCGPIGRYFTPQAGADYEVHVESNNGHCNVEVRQLLTKDGSVITEHVAILPAFECRK